MAAWRMLSGVDRALLAECSPRGCNRAELAIDGWVATSGPILRRAGFHVLGREVSCTIAL